MRDVEQIAAIIRKRLSAEWHFFEIAEVRVRADIGEFGDEILWVDVIYKGEYKNIDIKALTSVLALVRPELARIGEQALPVFSYVPVADAEKVRYAAEPTY